LLEEHGQLEQPPRELDGAEKEQYPQKLLETQLRAERELARSLPPEQLAALRASTATVFAFHPGGKHFSDTRRGSPF
jgi:hypothetical protein